ncbi:MAG: BadF/BadG/BcrA/BcrD ATPase family protein [Kiritimatiellae bacterium]|nr:BadF/BadG/BcrA/BcrD ATPase family protein [Kiritimatiellia bacterium]
MAARVKNDTCWLALDPGGTKCTALRIAADGAVLAFSRRAVVGESGRSAATIGATVEDVLAQAHCDQPMGVMCSLDCERHPEILERVRGAGVEIARMLYVGETHGALALADVSHGVVALAGTGSMVGGHTDAGRFLYLDGLGPLLGDSGSGFQIGLMTIRAAALAAQHAFYDTSLKSRVFAALGVATLRELISFSLRPLDRSVLASLARIADEEARAGDSTARRILERAAAEMAARVADLVCLLGMADTPQPFVGTGSVIQNSDLYWQQLCRLATAATPGLSPVRLSLPAVLGVALAGWRCAGQAVSPGAQAAWRARLLTTFETFKGAT